MIATLPPAVENDMDIPPAVENDMDMCVFGLMRITKFVYQFSILLTVKFQFCTRFASPKAGVAVAGAERIRAFLCLVGSHKQ
jgi:hypothetical protein